MPEALKPEKTQDNTGYMIFITQILKSRGAGWRIRSMTDKTL